MRKNEKEKERERKRRKESKERKERKGEREGRRERKREEERDILLSQSIRAHQQKHQSTLSSMSSVFIDYLFIRCKNQLYTTQLSFYLLLLLL